METFKKLGIVICLFVLAGFQCHGTQECGTWNFTDDSAPFKFGYDDAFTLTPGQCGHPLYTCKKDVMIEMERFLTDGNDKPGVPMGPSLLPFADANNWIIANPAELNSPSPSGYSGYFGFNADGSVDPKYSSPGRNGTADVLHFPLTVYAPELQDIVLGVDVAVCYSDHKILGYNTWSYKAGFNGLQKVSTGVAVKPLDHEFQSAVAAWNAWAKKHNAKAFPTLSDL